MNFFDINLAKALSGGSGGGNPNSTQVVTGGNIESPFVDVSFGELHTALVNGDASAKLSFNTGGADDQILILQGMGSNRIEGWSCNIGDTADDSAATYVTWLSVDGGLTYHMDAARVWVGSSIQDISSYAAFFSATVTIYWHPLNGSLPKASGVNF